MDPFIFRGVERLLVDMGGIASITFGFLLFKKSINEIGELFAKHGTTELTLRNVGPGVMFAAFGMAILIGALLSPIEIKNGSSTLKAQASDQASSVSWGLGGKQPEDWKSSYTQGFYNINKAMTFLDSPPKDQKELEESRMVSQNLLKFRDELAIQIFSEDAFELYKKSRADANLITTLPEDKKRVIIEISTLVTQ